MNVFVFQSVLYTSFLFIILIKFCLNKERSSLKTFSVAFRQVLRACMELSRWMRSLFGFHWGIQENQCGMVNIKPLVRGCCNFSSPLDSNIWQASTTHAFQRTNKQGSFPYLPSPCRWAAKGEHEWNLHVLRDTSPCASYWQ